MDERGRRALGRDRARFIAAEYGPHLEKWHEDHFYPREVWTKAGTAGLLCASMPEEYGGAGGTFAHEAVIDRQFALGGFDTFGAPLHSGIVAPYILHYGTEERKKRWLPKLATGELVGAIAMSEPGPAPTFKAYAPPRCAPATATCSTARKPSSPTASTPT
jgi:alkylation response protein AidB-like acyl-CoA dehydrogenase